MSSSDATLTMDYAPGLPTKDEFGDLGELSPGQLVTYALQQHSTDRQKGRSHYDLRLGTPETGLFSWAIPKAHLPALREKLLAVRTELHRHGYGAFKGRIGSGYGAGTVRQADYGSAVIHSTSPRSIQFTIAHAKVPVRYRLMQIRDDKWLLTNTTPQGVDIADSKPSFKLISEAELPGVLDHAKDVQAKIDGALSNFHIDPRGSVESYSPRRRVTGEPIFYTERMGLGQEKFPELADTVVRGEVYGEKQAAYRTEIKKALVEIGSLLKRAAELARPAKPKEDSTRSVDTDPAAETIDQVTPKKPNADAPVHPLANQLKADIQAEYSPAAPVNQVEGEQVLAVPGHDVKTQHYMDFIEGGNPSRYKFVPPGQIWIDQAIDPSERKFIVLHEMLEERLMRNRGLRYDPAHNIANRYEKKWRQQEEGAKTAEVVPFNELSGLLNSNLDKSLAAQRDRKIALKAALFDVVRYKGQDVSGLPYAERQALLHSIVGRLPTGQFGLPESAHDPVTIQKLVERISSGKHHMTQEGVVIDQKYKYKVRPDSTGYVVGTFPGEGRRKDVAGGILYSDQPGGTQPVGKIGTGFTDQELRDIVDSLKSYSGRPFRFSHRGQTASGNYREPSFQGWETDKPEAVPGAKAADLQEHQQRAIDKLKDTDALLVYHGMGSGKTLTALSAAEQLGMPLTVVGPASLRTNFQKEQRKHHIKAALKYYTYNKPPEEGEGLVAFDEAHRMGRAGTLRSEYPEWLRGKKTMFLTGTPLRNDPSELVPLLRGLGTDISRDPRKFNESFVESRTQTPGFWGRLMGVKPGVVRTAKNIGTLKSMLEGKVDYHAPSAEHYPRVEEKDIEVEMTPAQAGLYIKAMKGEPGLKYKVEHGIAPSKAEAGPMNAFLSATRQVSNYAGDYEGGSSADAPKLRAAVDEIRSHLASDPRYRGVTYSTYIGHGIAPIKAMLDEQGIPAAEYTGKISQKLRDAIVKSYNSGKIRQLLISGAGGEGLDLKGTKLLQIMEPHWNQPQLDQVKGRAIRYRSHEALPEAERKVEIQNFLATLPERGWLFKKRDTSADQYLRMLSQQKTQLNQSFLDALKEVGSKDAPERQEIKKALVEIGELLKRASMAKEVPSQGVPLAICGPDGSVKETLSASLADTPAKRARGLSHIPSLPPKAAMLFTSPGPFWMKDVGFDLDLVFLDRAGTVTSLGTMKQGSGRVYYPDPDACLALEMKAGTCREKGILKGCQVRLAAS